MTTLSRVALLSGSAALFICLATCLRAAKPEPRTVHAGAVDAVLRDLWQRVAPAPGDAPLSEKNRLWQMHLTAWLPGEWPPTPRTVWSRYVYGLDVTLDGSAGVSAPIARIERRSGEDTTCIIVPMEGKLLRIATHPVRPHGGWHYTLEDEKRILAQALALTSAPPAGARATLGLISYYQSWRLGSAEIAAQVAPQHRAFFRWLEAQ